MNIQGVTRDEDAFEQLVRILVNDVAILERAWLRFIRVTDQIHRFFFIRLDEAPFHAGRKTSPAATPQSGSLNLVKNVRPRHGDGLF